MKGFFRGSKSNAKRRLMACISEDRGRCGDGKAEKIRAEIEEVIKKYAELDGKADIEIVRKENNRVYITAGAYLKRSRL